MFYSRIAGSLLDNCLQYPVTSSLVASLGFYILGSKSDTTKGYQWIISCTVGFVLLTLVLVGLVPTLHVSGLREIFRPTPSCAIYDNPKRFICPILINHQQQFYITTIKFPEKCHPQDKNFKNATNFFIISSWIPTLNHYTTKREMYFEPAVVPEEGKKRYPLPENYCVRAAGPTSGDQIKVAFYSHDGSELTLQDTGYIDKIDLLELHHFGWYHISSCRTDLERWWYSNCETGYVSSHYVTLSENTKMFLLEGR